MQYGEVQLEATFEAHLYENEHAVNQTVSRNQPRQQVRGVILAFQEYENPEELRKVQALSTKLLREFDRVCRELNIQYVVWAGTALGAVRHQGFIPWDDDVDVAMLRKDYERFNREAPAIISEEFEIVNMRTEPNFVSMVTYLTLRDTTFIPDFFEGCVYKKPLSIDIDILDNMPDDEKTYKRQSMRTWIWGRLLFVSTTPTPYVPFDGWKKKLVHSACRVARGTMKLVGLTPQKIQNHWDKAAQAFENKNTAKVADYADRNPAHWSATKDELFPAIDLPFENIIVKVPKEYDTILTRNYGDYMTLPPVEQRKNHRPSQLDFGPY